jgi:glycosyltransferase involved in cell wall biosynthesis
VSAQFRLSICVPVYNSLIESFIIELVRQTKEVKESVEVVVLDDHSIPEFADINQSLGAHCNYFYLPKNVGRSRIRNLFLEHTSGEYLLFIDGDSEVIDPFFVQKYLDFIEENAPQVIVGASIYQVETPDREHLLRWKYSRKRESKNANERKKTCGGFKTNNFVIQRIVFNEVQFNEELSGYGHEDTLFGLDLARNNTSIDHIENPVLNRHLDSNHVFLMKTQNAVKNLYWIYLNPEYTSEIQHIRLLEAVRFLKKSRLVNSVRFLFWLTEPLCFFMLKNGFVSLKLFDFYKLGLFVRKIKV